MLIALGTMQLITCIYIIYICFKNRSMACFLWGTILFVFALPHFLLSLSGAGTYLYLQFAGYSVMFSEDVLNMSALFAILLNCTYLLTYYCNCALFGVPQINLSSNDIGKIKKSEFFIIFLYVIFMLEYFHNIYNAFGGFSNITWGLMFLNSQADNTYLGNAINAFTASLSGCLLYTFIHRGKLIFSILLILNICIVLITNSRGALLPIIGTIFAYLIYYKKIDINFSKILFILMGSILVVYFINFIGGLRDYSVTDRFKQENINRANEIALTNMSHSEGEMALGRYFYFYVMHDNNFLGFGEGNSYKRLALAFIPQRLAPDIKPEDFNITQGEIFTSNLNLHPTFYGDCYANFGFIGFLLGGLWGLIVYALDYIVSKNMLFIQCILIIPIMHGLMAIGRGYVDGGGFSILILLVVAIFIYIMKKIKIVLR